MDRKCRNPQHGLIVDPQHLRCGEPAPEGPTRSRAAGRAIAACLVASLVALSGCVGDDKVLEPLAEDIPTLSILPGTASPNSAGPWYEVEGLLTTPATVRIINEDTVFHRVLAVVADPAGPPWADTAEEAGDGHDHDHGHDHGDGGGSDAPDHHGADATVFDVSLEGGEWIDVEIAADGLLAIHCHPHPWMVASVEARPAAPPSYPVTVNQWIASASANGTTEAPGSAGSSDVPLRVGLPNLVSLSALLEWDDSVDDGPLGEDANAPDTFQVSLVAPNGEIAAREEMTARVGSLPVEFAPGDLVWPASIDAPSRRQAQLDLASRGGFEHGGDWRVSVRLVATPGYPDGDTGATSGADVPGADGRQSWTLSVTAVHEWASIGGEPQVSHVPLNAPSSGHDHGGHDH